MEPQTPPDADQIYLKLPIPPEMARALREHAENAGQLFAMFENLASVPPGTLLEKLQATAAAVARDVGKVQRARARRRR